MPTKTDETDEKNVRALIGFGEVKATKTNDFLCLNPTKFSTREATVAKEFLNNFFDKYFEQEPKYEMVQTTVCNR